MWINNGLNGNTDLAQTSGSNQAAAVPGPQRRAARGQPDLLEFTIDFFVNPCHSIAAQGIWGLLHLHLWAHSIHNMNLTQEQLELLNYPGNQHRESPDPLLSPLHSQKQYNPYLVYIYQKKKGLFLFFIFKVLAFTDSRGARISRQKKDRLFPCVFLPAVSEERNTTTHNRRTKNLF